MIDNEDASDLGAIIRAVISFLMASVTKLLFPDPMAQEGYFKNMLCFS